MIETATQGSWILDTVKNESQLNADTPDKPTSDEADVLKARILDGHNKLWKRWDTIRGIDKDDPQLARHFEVWDSACDKLRALCNDLVALGYKDCLYPIGHKTESFCLVCPKDPWTPETCLCWEVEL